jgi:hypothetical protein
MAVVFGVAVVVAAVVVAVVDVVWWWLWLSWQTSEEEI